jgi:hypothetical protein
MSNTFVLNRSEDKTGLSGTGIVADGVLFPNGKVVVCWRGDKSSIVIWNNIDEMKKVSCTHSTTSLIWDDESMKFLFNQKELKTNKRYYFCHCAVIHGVSGLSSTKSQCEHVTIMESPSSLDNGVFIHTNDIYWCSEHDHKCCRLCLFDHAFEKELQY